MNVYKAAFFIYSFEALKVSNIIPSISHLCISTKTAKNRLGMFSNSVAHRINIDTMDVCLKAQGSNPSKINGAKNLMSELIDLQYESSIHHNNAYSKQNSVIAKATLLGVTQTCTPCIRTQRKQSSSNGYCIDTLDYSIIREDSSHKGTIIHKSSPSSSTSK